MKPKRLNIALLAATALLLGGCQTNEQRIRDIVREELSSAMKRTVIKEGAAIGPYSPAQQVGNFLFVSGQIAMNPATGGLENKDIETETRQVLDNLMKVVRSAGFDSSDVLSTTVYLKDMADFQRMNAVYGGYFAQGNYPARATVQVAGLAKEARVEISAIAYRIRQGTL
jgi:2-iminobutanoate/2-iminopropanoate deaminase